MMSEIKRLDFMVLNLAIQYTTLHVIYLPYLEAMTFISDVLAQYAHLWLFFVLVIGIIALPGMDMAFVMANAISSGRRSGFAAVAGIMAGGLTHAVMSALGVGLLFAASRLAYLGLAVVGAVYMAWIGFSIARRPGALMSVEDGAVASDLTIARRALTTCLLNPKAYMFNIAVIPQFMKPEYGSMATQAFLIAIIVMATQGVIYGAVALGAAGLRERLRSNTALQLMLGRVVGVGLIAGAAWSLWQAFG
jgi:threonine/homoserine/homoserine lactone efflux protein